MRRGREYVPTPDDPPLQHVVGRGRDGLWRILVSTVMLNKSSRGAVDGVWPEFFGRWPDACETRRGGLEEQAEVLRPTGMQRVKAARVRAAAEWWCGLVGDDLDPRREIEEDVDLVLEIPGCGGYSRESVRVFWLGDLSVPAEDAVVELWRVQMFEAPMVGYHVSAPAPEVP